MYNWPFQSFLIQIAHVRTCTWYRLGIVQNISVLHVQVLNTQFDRTAIGAHPPPNVVAAYNMQKNPSPLIQ